jgi:hypothetical protein
MKFGSELKMQIPDGVKIHNRLFFTSHGTIFQQNFFESFLDPMTSNIKIHQNYKITTRRVAISRLCV